MNSSTGTTRAPKGPGLVAAVASDSSPNITSKLNTTIGMVRVLWQLRLLVDLNSQSVLSILSRGSAVPCHWHWQCLYKYSSICRRPRSPARRCSGQHWQQLPLASVFSSSNTLSLPPMAIQLDKAQWPRPAAARVAAWGHCRFELHASPPWAADSHCPGGCPFEPGVSRGPP